MGPRDQACFIRLAQKASLSPEPSHGPINFEILSPLQVALGKEAPSLQTAKVTDVNQDGCLLSQTLLSLWKNLQSARYGKGTTQGEATLDIGRCPVPFAPGTWHVTGRGQHGQTPGLPGQAVAPV